MEIINKYNMATSHLIYKKEITDYLKEKNNRYASVLDVGAGEGTWYEFLKDYFVNIEAVEIFKPNIDNFKLEDKYKKVYNEDIRVFKYEFYDIIIFGDIIEHLKVKEAQNVLKYALNKCNDLIVAVPYLNKQGIEEDNIYEIHKQDDLTNEIMKKRYPYLECVFKTDYYGYYIKEENMKNYLVKALIPINDYDGKDINDPNNSFVARPVGDEWYVTKKRAEYLVEKQAVQIIEIKKKGE